jgi:phage terminase large subunit-like protein
VLEEESAFFSGSLGFDEEVFEDLDFDEDDFEDFFFSGSGSTEALTGVAWIVVVFTEEEDMAVAAGS